MAKSTDLKTLKNNYGIVGRNEALDEALSTAVLVAPTDLSVLIQGESGVGKEVIPRIIHDNSKRSSKKYIAINCGSIPEGTIDSELFGHEKGAFTSAIGEHDGYFGAADGGTLFLDEVGELPMSTQARLLRVLETGEYLRVGSNTPRKTNCRIVAATNVDIPNAIKHGRFREDLYYRLCTINIKMPPLRDRHGDAVLLFKKFSLDMAEKYGIPEPLRLTPEAEAVINAYKWPGNIRELRNVTERMSIISRQRIVTPEVLAQFDILPNSDNDLGVMSFSSDEGTEKHSYEKEIHFLAQAVIELRAEVNRLKEQLGMSVPGAPAAVTPQLPLIADATVYGPITHAPIQTAHAPEPDEFSSAQEVVDDDEPLNLSEMERRKIVLALERNHYKRKPAADELGISERTLYRKIKDYGIEG